MTATVEAEPTASHLGRGAPAVDCVLTEQELAEEFVASLRSGRLDEKFFYWLPLSVRAWLALCGDGAYRNHARSRSVIEAGAKRLASLAPEGALEVLSLGSGQGDKDEILLRSLAAAGRRDVVYRPLDASQGLLEIACRRGLTAGIPTRGVKADFTRPDHVAALAATACTPPRFVLLLGNTLGAPDPVTLARTVTRLLRPGDLLLVDGEIEAGAETMAGYDNEINRRFAWAPLRSVGIGEDDGRVAFEAVEDAEVPGLSAVAKHFTATRPLRLTVAGETLSLEAGERVEMGRSCKYRDGVFVDVLRDAGLFPVWIAASDDGRLLTVLAGLAA